MAAIINIPAKLVIWCECLKINWMSLSWVGFKKITANVSKTCCAIHSNCHRCTGWSVSKDFFFVSVLFLCFTDSAFTTSAFPSPLHHKYMTSATTGHRLIAAYQSVELLLSFLFIFLPNTSCAPRRYSYWSSRSVKTCYSHNIKCD